MELAQIDFQLGQLSAKGMRGMVIHPRFGLQLPYLSQQWFDRVKYAVARAGELGLEVWLYDEMNWSSGRADNAVVRARPEFAETYLELVRMDQVGPTFTCLIGNDERYYSLGGSEICRVIAVPHSGNGLDFERRRDLTPQLCFGDNLFWDVPPGKWSIFFGVLRRSDSYVDTLNPEATRQFIAETHERYAQTIGDQFGQVVKGFYLDEPAMHYYSMCAESPTIPWTKRLSGLFDAKFGYHLEQSLLELFLDTGHRTGLVRHHYWSLVSDLYTDSFFSVLRDWCHAHGLLLTGHGLAEESLRLQARVSGNLFRHLRTLDLVGIDDLFHNSSIQKHGEQTRLVALKIASSAAHLGEQGCKPVLCESFGGCGWDVTLADLKKTADLEFAAGVTALNPHGYHYSLDGDRKKDWPASQFYHHPWWVQYPAFSQYAARVSWALSRGHHVAPVAVLFPHSAVWAGLEPGNPDDEAARLEERLTDLTNALVSTQWDFDYLCEEDLWRAEVRQGRLHLAEESFGAVILPGVAGLLPQVADRLSRFAESGGLVVSVDVLPGHVLAENPLPADVARLETLRARSTLLDRGAPDTAEGFPEALDRSLRTALEPDFALKDRCSRVAYLKRKAEDEELFFVTNQGDTKVETVAALRVERSCLSPDGAILAFHPDRDEPEGVRSTQVSTPPDRPGELARVDVPLSLEPGESVALLASPRATGRERVGWLREPSGETGARTDTVDLTSGFMPVTITGPNTLPLSSLRLSLAGEASGRGEGAGTESWPVEPGNWEPQVPLAAGYPVTAVYHTSFTCDYLPPDLAVLCDGLPSDATLRVNGAVVSGATSPSPFDLTIATRSIADLVRPGENELRIEIPVTGPQQGLRAPVRLCGQFRLERRADRGGWLIAAPPTSLKPGPWTAQGYPFFAGAMSYELRADLPADLLSRRVVLRVEAYEDAVDVTVNGLGPWQMPWRPYRLELNGALKEGANTIRVTIYNTPQGVWDGATRASGLGKAWLEVNR